MRTAALADNYKDDAHIFAGLKSGTPSYRAGMSERGLVGGLYEGTNDAGVADTLNDPSLRIE